MVKIAIHVAKLHCGSEYAPLRLPTYDIVFAYAEPHVRYPSWYS